MANKNPIPDFHEELFSITKSKPPVSGRKIGEITKLALKHVKVSLRQGQQDTAPHFVVR